MDLCPSSLLSSPLFKPLHDYACTLSLKLPQFCCSGRYCFGKDPQCSPYLLQVIIDPSFWSLAWFCPLARHPPRGEPSFQVTITLIIVNAYESPLCGRRPWCLHTHTSVDPFELGTNIPSLYGWGNSCLERFRHWPKATELVVTLAHTWTLNSHRMCSGIWQKQSNPKAKHLRSNIQGCFPDHPPLL